MERKEGPGTYSHREGQGDPKGCFGRQCRENLSAISPPRSREGDLPPVSRFKRSVMSDLTYSPSLRLVNFPISSQEASPLIPDLFHAQKNYIFRALEQDAFPRFLRAKAFGNLTPLGSFVRLILGLLLLWGGFVLAFSLIFLDHKPKRDRLWVSQTALSPGTKLTLQVILPFFLATNLLLSAYYSLSPLLAFCRQSETTPFRFIRISERYVRKLLLMRALWIEALCVAITAVLTVIFALVPGHRL